MYSLVAQPLVLVSRSAVDLRGVRFLLAVCGNGAA